jgi:hypothetical protein
LVISTNPSTATGDVEACRVLAKELVSSRKAVARINGGKAQLNSITLTLNHQMANVRVAGALEKSTEVLTMMNAMVRYTEMSATMQEMSREMMKAGLIEEMIEETIDEVTGIDEDEMEEQVAAEVDKVLFDLTEGLFSPFLHFLVFMTVSHTICFTLLSKVKWAKLRWRLPTNCRLWSNKSRRRMYRKKKLTTCKSDLKL